MQCVTPINIAIEPTWGLCVPHIVVSLPYTFTMGIGYMEIGLCTCTSMSMHVPAFVKSRYLQWKQSPLTNTTFIFAWLCEEFKNHCGSVPLFGEKTRCDQQHRNAIVHREASSGWPGNCTCFNDTLHAECRGAANTRCPTILYRENFVVCAHDLR